MNICETSPTPMGSTPVQPTSAPGTYSTIVEIGCLILAIVWSLASVHYRFGAGDDGWQAPMVLHQMDPHLLNRDPLITEVGRHYRSLLFPVLAWLGRATSLPTAYAIGYIINRVLTIATYGYLVRVATGSRAAAIIAAFLLTGFGFYGFGTYLSGTPLLEEKLVPRAFALPFAFAALAATIRKRHFLAVIWLLCTLAIHPVTGANAAGVYIVYTLLCYPRIAWRPFGIAVLIIICALIGSAFWTGQTLQPGDILVRGHWRQIVTQTVGRYVFIGQDTAWELPAFPSAVILGMLAMPPFRPTPLLGTYSKLLMAACLAMLVHLLGVDWLGIHPLLEASPERATFAVVAFVGIGIASMISELMAGASKVGRLVAGLLFLAIFFRIDARVVIVIALPAMVLATPLAKRGGAIFIGIVVGALIMSHLIRHPQIQYLSTLDGFQQLRVLGMDDPFKVEAENWIREHSDLDETLMPPPGNDRGWEIFSKRAAVFNGSLHTYTHLSRDFAMRYEKLVQELAMLNQQAWPQWRSFAMAQGADWLIMDERWNTPRGELPTPALAVGPYRVFPLRERSDTKR